jgi:hypothetical protein
MELALNCWDGDAVCWDQWNDRQRNPHSESADATLNESPDFLVFFGRSDLPPAFSTSDTGVFQGGSITRELQMQLV